MKKIVSLCLACFMFFSLAGCGNHDIKISNENKETLTQMIEVVDDYLDLEISGKEAQEKLERLENRLVEEKTEENSNDSLSIANGNYILIVAKGMGLEISQADSAARLGRKDEISANEKQLKEKRNEIAKAIGAKEK